MAYVRARPDWRDGREGGTPIMGDNLDHIEAGIEAATNAAEASVSTVAGFSGRVGAAEARLATAENGIAVLQTGKADTGHTHVIADVGSLQATLDGKAASSHTHTGAQITSGVVKTINGAAPDSAGNATISALSDGTSVGQLLRWNGTAWEPYAPTWTNIAGPAGSSTPSGYQPLSYRIDPGEVVRIRGALQMGSSDGYLTFPPAIRPAQTVIIPVSTGGSGQINGFTMDAYFGSNGKYVGANTQLHFISCTYTL